MHLTSWGEPERDPHDAVYGDFVCLSCCHAVCLYIRTFTFRIYSCSNSTITHAQNFRAKFFSHVVLLRVRRGGRKFPIVLQYFFESAVANQDQLAQSLHEG